MVRWTSPFFTGTICRLITHYLSKIMSNKVTKRPRTKYVLGHFVAGRNGTRELWMIILMYVFSNLRHKPGHKGQGCGVNLHVTVTKRWWGPEWKILIWILVTFNTDIDRDTHIEFCMISMLILLCSTISRLTLKSRGVFRLIVLSIICPFSPKLFVTL